MPFFWYDPTMIILLPAIFLAMYAQFKVQNTFAQYSRIGARSGLTGAEVAREILRDNRIYDVRIEQTRGMLTDHYDPRNKVLRLSPHVYNSSSLAALGVAAHEAGHVIQHQYGYIPFNIRTAIVPIATIGSQLAFPLLLIGLFLGMPKLAQVGVLAFSAAVLFQLVTLPVEYNASSRAIEALEVGGYLSREETPHTRKVLRAAALTYVAATLTAVLQLLRLLLISGAFGRRND
ncbi:MAG: zinc metallopeptidase [Clostridiales bacterium]|jgi:Zn-dependent membrane protease YugP|nr:zinc metallopeptidase [Clostridiales bacterium]